MSEEQKRLLEKQLWEISDTRPSLKERSSISERLTNRIVNFVDTFISGFSR